MKLRLFSYIIFFNTVFAAGYHVNEQSALPKESIRVIEVYDDVSLFINPSSNIANTQSVDSVIKEGVLTLRSSKDRQRGKEHNFVLLDKDGFRDLMEIRLYNNANLWALHINSPQVIKQYGRGSIFIDASVPLKLLEQSGKGETILENIKSNNADIHITKGNVKLSGNIKTLRLLISGSSVLDASKLVINDLWLNSKNQSRAVFSDLEEYHVVASDSSRIVLPVKNDYSSTIASKNAIIVYG